MGCILLIKEETWAHLGTRGRRQTGLDLQVLPGWGALQLKVRMKCDTKQENGLRRATVIL